MEKKKFRAVMRVWLDSGEIESEIFEDREGIYEFKEYWGLGTTTSSLGGQAVWVCVEIEDD